MTNKEVLSIMDTLLECKMLLYSIKIIVCTNHKNLTFNNTMHMSTRVYHQYLVLEEYECKIMYILGEYNNMANSLLRISVNDTTDDVNIEETFCLEKICEDNINILIKLGVIHEH